METIDKLRNNVRKSREALRTAEAAVEAGEAALDRAITQEAKRMLPQGWTWLTLNPAPAARRSRDALCVELSRARGGNLMVTGGDVASEARADIPVRVVKALVQIGEWTEPS